MQEPYEIFTPAEGVRVVACRTERFKTGPLSVQLVLPLVGDVSAFSLLPYLLSRTCRDYPDDVSFNRRLANLYGAEVHPSVAKHGENLVLRLSMPMIDSRFALHGEDIIFDCAKLLCKVLFEPNTKDGKFDEMQLAREKRIRLERLDSLKNDKRGYAMHRCLEEMCSEENYRIDALGTKEGVAALTAESVYAAWQTMLQTARIQVNVVGTGSVEKIADLFGQYIAQVPRKQIMNFHTDIVERAQGAVKRVVEEAPVRQGKLVLGFRAGTRDPQADYAAIRVMTDLFGGGPYSRCFMNVREKQSLCYYCSARYLSQKGLIMVQSGIENENAERVIAEVQKQLQDLADGNVTQKDMDNSHRALVDGLHSVGDTPEDLDGWASLQTCELEVSDPEKLADALAAVTADQVIAAAKNVTLDTVFFLRGNGEGEDE